MVTSTHHIDVGPRFHELHEAPNGGREASERASPRGREVFAILRDFRPSPGHGDGRASYRIKLALAALKVVYGDIGPSPLYAMRECFNEEHGI